MERCRGKVGNIGDQEIQFLNVALVIAMMSVRLCVCYQIDGYIKAERLLEGQGCWGAVDDARSSLLAKSWWPPPARRSARPVSGTDLYGFMPRRGHPNGFQALSHTAGLSNLPGQGGLPSVSTDGLRYLLT